MFINIALLTCLIKLWQNIWICEKPIFSNPLSTVYYFLYTYILIVYNLINNLTIFNSEYNFIY